MSKTATYSLIASNTLGSAAASTTFSSIPATFTDLVIIFNGSITTGFDSIAVTANNDTATNYSRTVLSGNGTAASSFNSTSTTSMQIAVMGTENSNSVFQINDYSNTTTYKTFLVRSNASANATRASIGLWRSTAAINRIDLTAGSSTFIAGSTFKLYGIQAGSN